MSTISKVGWWSQTLPPATDHPQATGQEPLLEMLVLGEATRGQGSAEGVWHCADPGSLGAGVGAGEEAPHSLVHKQGWGVGPRGLQVLHGVPLVDAALLGADAALVVAGPDQSHAPREVVVPSSHFTGLVKDLQGGPG